MNDKTTRAPDFPPGLIIAAPASGSGKTTLTLALHQAFQRAGQAIAPVKVGPDYIDPAYHARASGRSCYSLDPWAMRPHSLRAIAGRAVAETVNQNSADWILAEGVMGLFDGGAGSTAALALETGWPVVLVVDVTGMSESVAALIHGFTTFHKALRLRGVILNKVGSPRHARLLQNACAGLDIPLLGLIPRESALGLPTRHLGLVQASEHPDLDRFLTKAAEQIRQSVDCIALAQLAHSEHTPTHNRQNAGLCAEQALIPPLGQSIAIAQDRAFAFVYPAVLESWQAQGCHLSFFSPLRDDAPAPNCDAVYLPGGYPELHAAQLAANQTFLDGLRQAARRRVTIYGECGGYMTLGRTLTDQTGQTHRMAGLLPVDTSLIPPQRALGYRTIRCLTNSALGPAGSRFKGHEFHYSHTTHSDGPPLFSIKDITGTPLGSTGCHAGTVMGSYLHLLDRVE